MNVIRVLDLALPLIFIILIVFAFIHNYRFIKYLRTNKPAVIRKLQRKSIFFKKPILPTYTLVMYCLDLNEKDPKIKLFKIGYLAFIVVFIFLVIISFKI